MTSNSGTYTGGEGGSSGFERTPLLTAYFSIGVYRFGGMWNGGIVEWLDGRLTTLYCFTAVTVINTHAHFGATVTSLFVADIHMTAC